ncbi:hypothetical protein PHMEG_0006151 [Phytophthora megakarya]|uniref:Uncharacterized protein n=1 Tax=Phytophthora megakarya TaxID=4795 RepID=A0A225WPV4_9STRA|nr:hypothetical protein PHMEG_0006151 [Phytophthora megakarya]
MILAVLLIYQALAVLLSDRCPTISKIRSSKRTPVSSPAAKRTPVSSPVSASTSVSTPVVDPASVPASSHVSAVPPPPLGGTTGKNFSVDKYYELQDKKLELRAKQRPEAAKLDSPKTIFDGSSILSADSGIPVDYEDGEFEDEATSSSQSHESKPASGTRRPREDDSDASSSKRPRSSSDAVPSRLEALAITSERRDATRTDDTGREPWMPSQKVIDDRYGATAPPNEIPLYVDSRIVDDAEAAAKHFDNLTKQRRDYYISLYHELRYWSSKKTSGRSRVPECQALCQSWNQFVANFNSGPAYRERIASARERFIKFSKPSVVQPVHEGSVNANIPCAVPEGVHCPRCPTGAPRISERDLTGYTTNRVPANVKALRAKLVCTRQHSSVSVVGFVRHHLFRTVRHQDVSGKPRISKETRLSPTSTKTNRTFSDWYDQQSDPPRGGSYRGQSYASVGGVGRSSYGQPRVDQGLQALHARVEALWTVQVSESAEVRQLLLLQKACVADVAQTASNIRVEVFEQVRPLQEKVKRLEEKLRMLRVSSSTSHHG